MSPSLLVTESPSSFPPFRCGYALLGDNIVTVINHGSVDGNFPRGDDSGMGRQMSSHCVSLLARKTAEPVIAFHS